MRKLCRVLVGGFSEGNGNAEEKSLDDKHFHVRLFWDDSILFKLSNVGEARYN